MLDLIDTYMKGADYFARLGPEYLFRAALAVAIASIAAYAKTPRTLTILGLIWLAYDLSWILRLYDVL